MKFLVIANFRFEERDKWPAKAAAFAKAMEEHSERFPTFPVGLHIFANTTCHKAIAIWETDSPEKLAYKLAFMLPEVSYEVIPLISFEDWFKQYKLLTEE